MKLEQLRPNLYELPEDQAFQLFQNYYEKRSVEIQEVMASPKEVTNKKKTVRKAKEEVVVTASELAMLKKLGLI